MSIIQGYTKASSQTTSHVASSIHACPMDILIREIFSRLNKTDLSKCSQVCSDWQMVCSNDVVLKQIATETFGNVPSGLNLPLILQEFGSRHLNSSNEIMDRLQDFLGKVSLGHNARFRCVLRTGKYYKELVVEIKGNKDPIQRFSIGATPKITNLDPQEAYFALDVLRTDPSFWAPASDAFESNCSLHKLPTGEFLYEWNAPLNGPFQGTLRIGGLFFGTKEIEEDIGNVIQTKLGEFVLQDNKNTFVNRIAVGALLTSFAAALYLGLSD